MVSGKLITIHKGNTVKKASRSSNKKDIPPSDTLQRIQHLKEVLEQLYEEIERQQDISFQHYEQLKSETSRALDEVRIHMNILLNIDAAEPPLSYQLPIKDEPMKKAWHVLFKHPDGATAETVASELNRHRSTVVTTLIQLKKDGYATSTRKGHQIMYKAIIKTGNEE